MWYTTCGVRHSPHVMIVYSHHCPEYNRVSLAVGTLQTKHNKSPIILCQCVFTCTYSVQGLRAPSPSAREVVVAPGVGGQCWEISTTGAATALPDSRSDILFASTIDSHLHICVQTHQMLFSLRLSRCIICPGIELKAEWHKALKFYGKCSYRRGL